MSIWLHVPAQAAAGSFDGPHVVWKALTPEMILLGGALLLMVVSVLTPRPLPRGTYAIFTAVTGATAMGMSFWLWHDVRAGRTRSLVGGALGLDGFSVFFMVVICSSVVITSLLADDYLRREGLDGCEVYALILLSATGGIVMASANDLVVVFLGLETLSIALYVLAASHLRRNESQEAAIKYFVLGGFSSAFFLYGVALVYGATGSTNLARIAAFLNSNVLLESGLLLGGFALLLVGLGFKVAAAPFHAWVPDVYQGSPTPVSGFMASAAKAAAFGALLRVFYLTFPTYRVDWKPIVWVLAVVTLAVGSILAVVQTDVKRMLAYSSIAHAGFILVGVEAASAEGTAASLFYLLAYTFMVLGSFGVVTLVSGRGDANTGLSAFRGLGRRRPVLAFAFTVFLLAQAGVPFTSGFFAKFYAVRAAVNSNSYALAIVAMVSAVVAAFLYLRIIVSMYLSDDDAEGEAADIGPRVRIPPAAGVALTIAFAFTVVVGFLPSRVVDFARDAVPVLIASR